MPFASPALPKRQQHTTQSSSCCPAALESHLQHQAHSRLGGQLLGGLHKALLAAPMDSGGRVGHCLVIHQECLQGEQSEWGAMSATGCLGRARDAKHMGCDCDGVMAHISAHVSRMHERNVGTHPRMASTLFHVQQKSTRNTRAQTSGTSCSPQDRQHLGLHIRLAVLGLVVGQRHAAANWGGVGASWRWNSAMGMGGAGHLRWSKARRCTLGQ